MIIAKILLKSSPVILMASFAPSKEPKKADIPKYILKGYVETPLLLNPLTAVKVCIKIAILFVPFAIGAGSPKNNKVGKVNNVPPPAIVFRKPAIKPIGIKSKYSIEKSIILNNATKILNSELKKI